MKNFKEYLVATEQLDEVIVNQTNARSGAGEAFRELNRDRIGQPILNVSGNEVRNSVVLSDSSFAQKQGRGWRITSYGVDGTLSTIEITSDELKYLK